MVTDETIYVGSQQTVPLSIDCGEFDMATDEWVAVVKCGRKSATYTRENAVNVDGEWLLLVDTGELGVGLYWLCVEYSVPDPDWEGGVRKEVNEVPLFNVMRCH